MTRTSSRLFLAFALAVTFGLAMAVSPFASGSPDGLEKVATDKGFADSGRLHAIQDSSPVPGYAFPGIDNERVATGLAGFVGVLGVVALATGLGYVIRRRHPDRGGSTPGAPVAPA
ncbi:MAG: PDGLE domain-containing protein [Solirubrobacterales bacterium]|nr:PDGLE domain-containing protein [Solirubrobacterales bacterium]